jgi:hypothetical protein
MINGRHLRIVLRIAIPRITHQCMAGDRRVFANLMLAPGNQTKLAVDLICSLAARSGVFVR